MMNNPVRAALQNWYEAPLLERLGGCVNDLNVLEVGCGRGIGTEIIFNKFRANRVSAFDIDPDMVRRARVRLAHYSKEKLNLTEGSVTKIQEDDCTFDAVFDFGIVHHVPNWRDAVSEIFRVLKPGGKFYFEEVTKHALDRWFYRTFLKHPSEDRFTGDEFVSELRRQGFEVLENQVVYRFFGDFIIGAGTKRI